MLTDSTDHQMSIMNDVRLQEEDLVIFYFDLPKLPLSYPNLQTNLL